MNLSICVQIKNRSRVKIRKGIILTLFQDCIKSLNYRLDEANKIKKNNVELVIVDFYSNDKVIENWIYDKIDVDIQLIKCDKHFCRGLGRNIAYKNAKYDNIFFMDSDMKTGENLIDYGISVLENNKVFFPYIFYCRYLDCSKTRFVKRAFGNNFIHREKVDAVNGWDEDMKWGKDDIKFYNKIKDKFKIHRGKRDDYKLYHMWHPKTLRKRFQKSKIVKNKEK